LAEYTDNHLPFIKIIPVGNRFVHFRFTRLYTTNGFQYLITTMDSDKIIFNFFMEKRQGIWSFANLEAVPEWIRRIGPLLSRAIEKGHND